MKERELTEKQRRFVQEYFLTEFNATRAAINAGYSAKTASRIGPELLGKSCIKAAIDARRAEMDAKVNLTEEFILNGLIREALGRGPDTNSAARTAALRLLGQTKAMFVERQRNEGETRIVVANDETARALEKCGDE